MTCPMVCGPEEFVCPGGVDSMGCMMPDMCMPSKGNFVIQGPQYLIPNKKYSFKTYQGPMDLNGVECPALCPTMCAPGDMMCPGGMTETGCMLPDTCQPEGTECPMPPMPAK